MKKIKRIGALALSVLCAMSLLTGAALAEGSEVSVSASGTIYMQPEQVTFSVGVSESASTVVEAQSKVNKSIASVIDALVEAGVPRTDIAAGYLSLYAEHNYNTTPAEIIGYNANHQLDVKTTDIENVGKIIDAALGAGANQLNSVNFGILDGSESYREALIMALGAAKEKAQILAAASGMNLGGIVRVEEQQTYGSWDSFYSNVAKAESAAGDGTPTEISAGNIAVTATVTAVFALVE